MQSPFRPRAAIKTHSVAAVHRREYLISSPRILSPLSSDAFIRYKPQIYPYERYSLHTKPGNRLVKRRRPALLRCMHKQRCSTRYRRTGIAILCAVRWIVHLLRQLSLERRELSSSTARMSADVSRCVRKIAYIPVSATRITRIVTRSHGGFPEIT